MLKAPAQFVRSIGRFLRDLRLVLGDGLKRLPMLLLLMLVASGLDLLGVALTIPFLSIVVGTANDTGRMSGWLRRLGAMDIAVLGGILLVVFVVKAYAASRVQGRIATISEGERARLMVRLLAVYQARPYEFHLNSNSSELINRVTWYTDAFTGGVLANLLRLGADGLVVVALAVFLALSDIRAVLLLAVLLVGVFLGVTRGIRTRLREATEETARLNGEVMQSVSQALGALREVRILGRERYFLDRLRAAAAGLVAMMAVRSSLQLVPRQTIEVIMVAFLVVLVWLGHAASGGAALVPVLGMFAAAAVRLMPASTALLTSWNGIRAHRFALRSMAEELSAVTENALDLHGAPRDEGPEEFRELLLDDVTMGYSSRAEPVLRSASLRISAGEVIGVIGRSGAGKSTLADVMLGLLKPQSGTIRVNGWEIHAHVSRWHRMVAYIPQSAYLLDDTLRRNIALGVEDAEIDDARLQNALASSQLGEFLAHLPEGLDTVVGERGVRLSGGQRQRVAIARALYHGRQFLILDEATSALDTETERAVVASVGALAGRMTIIVIAHRESTLVHTERLIVVDDGSVSEALAVTVRADGSFATTPGEG